jgi:hypothetical protein
MKLFSMIRTSLAAISEASVIVNAPVGDAPVRNIAQPPPQMPSFAAATPVAAAFAAVVLPQNLEANAVALLGETSHAAF